MKSPWWGVPSSAGAYRVSLERAPAALRQADLVEALRASGSTSPMPPIRPRDWAA